MALPGSSLTIWSCLSAGLLVLLASALVLSPRLLLFLSQTGTSQQRTALTSLEAFLAVHFGVYLVAVALALVLNTPEAAPVPSTRDNEPSHPLLAPLTIASNTLAFISWNTKDVGTLATITFVINAVVGIWGLWTVSALLVEPGSVSWGKKMLFSSSNSISKTTGADKHTSAFLFGNKAAASSQKKAAKKDK